MVRNSSKFKKFTAITTALALITSNSAMALPSGGSVTSGNANIVNTANTTTINQSSHGANINWNTFSSATGEAINFNQPNSSAYTINHVTGGVPSVLAGAMNANGHVIVQNEAGINFAGGQVSVGSLTATTAHNVSVSTDANGVDTFGYSGLSNAAIVNSSNISAGRGGLVVLNAQDITNNGTITTQRGTVALAATDGLTVTSDGKINYQPSSNVAQSIIANNGSITANGGVVQITNEQAADITKSVINLNGVVDVSCLDCNGDPNQAGSGGTVQIASAGDIKTTSTNKIFSNGGALGTGGNISLDAGGTLNVDGTITANGGSTSGNGGNVSLHGNDFAFQDTSSVDASATSGAGGNIKIGSNNDVHLISNGGMGSGGALNQYNKGRIGVNSQKGVNTEINGSNIIVDDMQSNNLNGGTGNIALRTVDKNGTLFSNGGVTFANSGDSINTTSGNISMLAGAGGINIGSLKSLGDATHTSGQINLTTQNGGNIVANNITNMSPVIATNGNQLVISSDGDATVNGKIYIDSYNYNATVGDPAAQATASIIAKGSVNLNDDVQVLAIDTYRPNINPLASLYVEAGHNAAAGQTGNITTKGGVYVYSQGYSSQGDVVTGIHDVGANAQFIAKDSISVAKDIFVDADSTLCIFPIYTHANLELIAQNGNLDTSHANVLAMATTNVTGSHADSNTYVTALKGTASIGGVGSISQSTCCTGAPSGQSTALTTVYAGKINFDGVDPYSEANYNVTDNTGNTTPGQFYQSQISGFRTDGNDRAEVRINQNPVTPPVTPPGTCQDNCTPINPIPIVNLPPSSLANLAPAAGNGNFCENVNISSLPGLCFPEAPHVAELAPASGVPIPFKFGPSEAPKKLAMLKPKSGRCVNVTKPNGGKDVVCIKDEIDK